MIQITDIGGDKREFYRPVRLCNTQHALKGQKLLAQGSALGIMAIGKAPCKGKSLKIHLIKMENPLRYVKLLPFTFPLRAGDRWFRAPGLRPTKTQGAALG